MFFELNKFQEIRELQELQRTVYTFLHVITTHDLSEVFLSPKSRGYLDPMMQLLLHTSCHHKDTLIRKVSDTIHLKFSDHKWFYLRLPEVGSLVVYTHTNTYSWLWLITVFFPLFQACVQIFTRLIKDWCSKRFGDEKVIHTSKLGSEWNYFRCTVYWCRNNFRCRVSKVL